MAQSFRLKRFTNVAILKRIDFPLLLEFFESDRAFCGFLQRRGLTWTRDVNAFDFEELARILMSPSVDTPDELLDALYFVDNLADPDCYDRILKECRATGIELGNADPSPEDLTLRVWLANRNILERIHAEQYRVRPKKFESYFAARTVRPDLGNPSAPVLPGCSADCSFGDTLALPPPVPGYGYHSPSGEPFCEQFVNAQTGCFSAWAGAGCCDGHICQCSLGDFPVCKGEAAWVAVDLNLDGSGRPYRHFPGRNGGLPPYDGRGVPRLRNYDLTKDPATWMHDCPCETWTGAGTMPAPRCHAAGVPEEHRARRRSIAPGNVAAGWRNGPAVRGVTNCPPTPTAPAQATAFGGSSAQGAHSAMGPARASRTDAGRARNGVILVIDARCAVADATSGRLNVFVVVSCDERGCS